MKISAELEKYIDELDKNQEKREAINNHIDLAKKERENFVSIFPRGEIRNINVLDYVPGKTIDGDEPDRKTFAYLTEFGSRNFGGIGGGSAKKFAIYMKKDTQELVFPPNFTSSDEAYDHTINLIADCVDYAEEYIKTNNWKKFSDVITDLVESKSGTPSIPIISKIIAIYYPDEFIRLWSHQWLNKTLDLFEVKRDDLPEGGKEGKFYEKMQRVVEVKNSHPIMKEWSNEYFSYGIGDYLDPKNKEKDNVSPLLKFVRDEMLMRANYQPIVIKMLLEKKDEAFTVSIDDIRKKFDELNFGRYSYTNTSSGDPMGNSAISAVKKALEKFVTFPDSTSKGKAALHLDQFNGKDIPEILKICGQKLVKYHIENLMEDERKYWFVQAGRKGENLEKFREGGYVAVDYKDVCDFNLSGLERDEIGIKTGGEKVQELLNISQIKQGDVVAVVKGNKTVEEFAIATSDYYFVNSDSERDKHRVNIEYLNFGTLEFGKNWNAATMQDASGKIKNFLLGEKSESGNYYIITQNTGSKYNDIPGKEYEYPSRMGKEFVAGTNFIIQSRIDGKPHFIGYGKVREIKESSVKDKNGKPLLVGKFSKYTEFDEAKLRTDEINSKMLWIAFPNTGRGSPPPSMLKVDRGLFYEIIDGDLIKDEQGSDTLNVEPFRHALKWKPNLVLYGPPGTGKTFYANEIAESIVGDDSELIAKVTFHPSYSYEDFVEGYRPVVEDESSKQYELKKGIFWETCEKARRIDPDLPPEKKRKVILIIDEINRGNIPKIFGELITLIEEDKRKEKHALKLAYSQKSFFVPKNLLIIGTMNTADKSLMQMDDALKRRFVFEELMPDTKALRNNFRENSVSDGENYAKILEKINEKIIGKGAEDEKQKKIQFRDRQIGQSYFWNVKNDGDLQDVMKYDIIPLLQDYFYGDYDEIRNVLGEKIIGDDNRPTSLVSQRDKARNLKDELLRI